MQFFWFGAILLCAALLPVFLAENWCRRHKVKKIFPVPRGMGWLQRTAVWLLCHLPDTISCSRWLTGCSEDIVGKLYPGMKKEKFIRQHVIRKMMVGYGGMLAILAFMMIYGLLNQTPELSGNNLQRDDAGGKSRDVQVSAEIEGVTEEKSLTITVEPRKYSRSEREALMRDVKAYIDACLQGDNSDLQHVNRPLFFPSDFPGENVTIEWQPEDYNLIRQDGSLGELSAYQLPIKTKVTAVIIYDQEKEFYSKEICLTAPEKSDEEVLDEQIREAVQAADQGSSEKLTLHLPDSVGGRVVEWKYQKQSQAGTILFIAFLFLAGCIWYQDNNLKKRLEERNEQLLYAYPGFVHRMILMLGAGMTVRRSWNRLLDDNERLDSDRLKEDWLYREMKYTRIQMESGVPEIQAYLEFGQRMELQQYKKFSQLLIQYIKRGSKGMQALMQQEAAEAEKQRRDLAKQLGETAGTKLLMPMMLLLIIVLLIVMVPAFLSM